MFHSNTELLLGYWRGQRGGRALPLRSDIDPAGFFALAPWTFIAVRAAGGGYRFRLAGEAIIDLHGRGLAGEELSAVWRAEHRPALVRALGAALAHAAPFVVTALATSDRDGRVRLEVLFAPLAAPDGVADRFLGLYQPLTPPSVLEGRPVLDLAIQGIDGVQTPAHGLRLASLDGQRIA